MIRRTLAATQAATFSVDLPNPDADGMTTPHGTGFFVSPDGYFVTAAHVVSVATNVLRTDIADGWLTKEAREFGTSSPGCQWPDVVCVDYAADFALLKVDWERNKGKD